MYAKIFESIYDGTISVNWKALVTFQQLIILCDADGVIDMTPPAISRRTNIPIDIIEEGLEYLAKPDQYSRSKDHEGRRIILMDEDRIWGWKIVNYNYYRNLVSREDKKQKDRIRIAEKRRKIKDVATCRDESQKSHIQTQTKKKKEDTIKETDLCAFDDFWILYPKKVNKRQARLSFSKLKPNAIELIMKDIKNRYNETDRKYIPHATTYLNGERWEDEVTPIADDNAWEKNAV